jgi:hypothetical protein
VLDDEVVLVELDALGFTLVRESDPVALRYRVAR